jgi:hypothetical protein
MMVDYLKPFVETKKCCAMQAIYRMGIHPCISQKYGTHHPQTQRELLSYLQRRRRCAADQAFSLVSRVPLV